MEKFLLISCLATVGSAIFFPFINLPDKNQSMMRVCIYSRDPARYQPKCILCPSQVYAQVLRTCVNAAAIPVNVSYTQAACIEQNCMINRGVGKRSVDNWHLQNELDDGNKLPLLLPYDDDSANDGSSQHQQQSQGQERGVSGQEQKSQEQERGDSGQSQEKKEETDREKLERQLLNKFHIVGTEEVFADDSMEDYDDGVDYPELSD